MHAFLGVVMDALFTLTEWTTQLASRLADFAGHPLSHADFVLANVVGTSLIVASICVVWAAVVRIKAAMNRRAMHAALGRAQSEIRFREALVAACPEAVAVLGADMEEPLSYRGGGALLQACLSGPQGATLAAKLNGLLTGGAAFKIVVTTVANRSVTVRGCPVGSRAAVFLQGEDPAADAPADYRATLDALPVPVWVRKPDLSLNWANQAYLEIAGTTTIEEARSARTPLLRCERELSRAACEGNSPLQAKRYLAVGGERRAYALNIVRQSDRSVIGSAVDITDATQAEGRLRLEAEAQASMLDKLDVGVAVFGPDKRLISCNQACRTQWGLKKEWLATHPDHSDVFDRLRETRRLPERRDFSEWKKEQQSLFGHEAARFAETWHLADGASFEVTAHGDALGGVYYFFQDVTARLRSEAAYNSLQTLDRAILDTLEDGMAVFGPDGRLQLYNETLMRLWDLKPEDLDGEPHLSVLADLCASRPGYDVVWKIVSAAVNASEPARFNDWIKILPTTDGRTLSLSVSRLPLGATLVRFEDITDQRRFEEELGGTSDNGSKGGAADVA